MYLVLESYGHVIMNALRLPALLCVAMVSVVSLLIDIMNGFMSKKPTETQSPAVPVILPERPKILLVDDTQLNRVIISRMLLKLGFDVIQATNGQECLDIFHEKRSCLSCIFLDLQMPVLDGWQTAQQVRLLEREGCWDRVPIVACTASYSEVISTGVTASDKAFASGVDDCMAKPVSLNGLRDVLIKNARRLPC